MTLPSQSAGRTLLLSEDWERLKEIYDGARNEAYNGIFQQIGSAAINSAQPHLIGLSAVAKAALFAENSKLKGQRDELVAALENIEAGLDAEIVRADGSGAHLAPLQAVASCAIVKAGGDSMHSAKLKEAGS